MSIEAMKLALEALEKADKIRGFPNNKKAITALRQAIEQAQKQELDDGYCNACSGDQCTAKAGCVALSNQPPQREWVGLTDEEIEAIGKDDKVLLAQFHTSVKAIDEMKDPTAQIMNLVIRQQGFNFAKAIEAKLREKNGG